MDKVINHHRLSGSFASLSNPTGTDDNKAEAKRRKSIKVELDDSVDLVDLPMIQDVPEVNQNKTDAWQRPTEEEGSKIVDIGVHQVFQTTAAEQDRNTNDDGKFESFQMNDIDKKERPIINKDHEISCENPARNDENALVNPDADQRLILEGHEISCEKPARSDETATVNLDADQRATGNNQNRTSIEEADTDHGEFRMLISDHNHRKARSPSSRKKKNHTKYLSKVKERTLQCLLTVLTGFCMLVTLTCIILTASWIHAGIPYKDGALPGKAKPYFCVSCDELTLNGTVPETEKVAAKLTKLNDSKQCCVGNSDEMSAFLEKVLTPPKLKEDQNTFDPTNFTLSHASAHVFLQPNEVETNGTYEVKFFGHDLKMKLNLVKHSKEHERGVKVDSDGLTILHPGKYWVYLGIEFSQYGNKKCDSFEKKVWYGHLKRARPGLEPETLLTLAYTCKESTFRITETKYGAGVFDLHVYDKLHAYVSGMGFVAYQFESTFLGLMKLGGDQ